MFCFLVDTSACDAYGQVWVGGTDSAVEGTWKWSNDDSAVTDGWYTDEPDTKDRCNGCRVPIGRKKRSTNLLHVSFPIQLPCNYPILFSFRLHGRKFEILFNQKCRVSLKLPFFHNFGNLGSGGG